MRVNEEGDSRGLSESYVSEINKYYTNVRQHNLFILV